ncbi:MAG: NAD-dependent epimerase/dehydratase family protein [Acidobacteriota bacterium]
MSTIRTALVGCGRISDTHIETLKTLPNVEVVALCDLNATMARDQAARYGIAGVYTDMEQMMREVQPNVVHLLTPPRTHRALALIAAKYHAHMYVEKPLASSLDDARCIVEAAKNAGVHVCPGHSLLFDPCFLEACRRIREGEVGEIISVRVEQGFSYEGEARGAVIPWSYTYDWGLFENLMTHALYVACHFLNEPGDPQVVALNPGQVREAAVEEIRVLIPSANAIGEVSLSLCAAPECNRLEVVGTSGRIMIDFVTMTVVSRRSSGLPSFVDRFSLNFRTAASLIRSGTSVAAGIVTGKVKRYMGLRGLILNFYESLEKGIAPSVLPEHGILNLRLMDQIKASCGALAKRRAMMAAPDASAMPPKALVTGASGFLGGQVVERLSAEAPVRAMTRLVSRARQRPGVEWIQGDLGSEMELRKALNGIETVFHCAALAGPPGSLQDYEEANVTGTVRLARLAAEAGVKTLVYVSSLAVYGIPGRGGPYVDETAPYDEKAVDRGFYTQTKLAAERALLEYVAQHSSPRVVILRPGSIYGPGVKLPIGNLQLPSSTKRPLIAGGRGVPMALTYVANVVDAMIAAANSDVRTGRVYDVVDSEVSQGEVGRTLREVSHGYIRPIFVPYPVVWSMMLGIDLLSLIRRRKLGTARYRLKRTLANMKFKSAAARSELKWQPRVSLADALTRSVESSPEVPHPASVSR